MTSAMLVMSDTPVNVCSYASMDIEARSRQRENTMITDTVPDDLRNCSKVSKNARTSLIVSLTKCFSLNDYNRV